MLITLFDGNPLKLTSNAAVAAVSAPAASRVRLNVIVAAPRALASAPAVGGTSFEASRFAVNTATFWLFEGEVVESDPHAPNVAASPRTTSIRFIESPPLIGRDRLSKRGTSAAAAPPGRNCQQNTAGRRITAYPARNRLPAACAARLHYSLGVTEIPIQL